jgi:hypothetical protein
MGTHEDKPFLYGDEDVGEGPCEPLVQAGGDRRALLELQLQIEQTLVPVPIPAQVPRIRHGCAQ